MGLKGQMNTITSYIMSKVMRHFVFMYFYYYYYYYFFFFFAMARYHSVYQSMSNKGEI